jgi:5-methylcytosine-specific restriction protein A
MPIKAPQHQPSRPLDTERIDRNDTIDRERQRVKDNGAVYDKAWRKCRNAFIAYYPLCAECERNGRVTAAEHIHHIVPAKVDPSRRLDWSNLLSVCASCHSKIEAALRR